MSSFLNQFKDFMANFQNGHLVGVDIGLSAIKVCLLSPQKKSYRIEYFGSIPLPEAAIIEDEIEKPEEIIALLDDLLKKYDINTKIACLGVDGPNTFTKRLQVPDGSKEDVEDNILWESEQYIPFSADESELDFIILGTNEETDIKDVLVASVKNTVVERFSKILTGVGLIVRVVDLKCFALVNLFEAVYASQLSKISEAGCIIIDFGAQTTKVIAYKNGGPSLTKEISSGGILITEEIQRRLGVSYEEAEDLKIYGDAKGNLPEEVVDVISVKVDELLDEIKKILNFYIAAGSSEQVEYCFITGGNSRTPTLKDRLSEVLSLPVDFINPLDVLSYNKKNFKGQSEDYINSCGVVAMGLALRKV